MSDYINPYTPVDTNNKSDVSSPNQAGNSIINLNQNNNYPNLNNTRKVDYPTFSEINNQGEQMKPYEKPRTPLKQYQNPYNNNINVMAQPGPVMGYTNGQQVPMIGQVPQVQQGVNVIQVVPVPVANNINVIELRNLIRNYFPVI